MENRTTSKGTPWAATWDEGWAATVEAVEGDVGRRVCGAKTLAGTPCSLSSEHRTGRCAFHGGTDAIGAPVGNSNARVHGLYARRLQRCGTHCPMWDHCPFASAEVLALELPERPVCAYEAEEYDRVLGSLCDDSQTGGPSSVLAESSPRSRPRRSLALPDGVSAEGGPGLSSSAYPRHADSLTFSLEKEKVEVHNLALLQVMVSRAAAALSVATFTDTVTSESDRYRMESTKVHASLDAFVRLTREHRATFKDFRSALETVKAEPAPTNAVDGAVDPNAPWGLNEHGRPISLADFATPLIERTEGVLEEAIEAENQRKAYTHRLEAALEKHAGPDWRNEVEAEAQPP